MRRLLALALALVVLVPALAGAQAPVQQSASMLNACTNVANANAAVNNQVTATATASAGQYVYVCGIDWQACTNGTATAQANVTFTSTNLPGSPKWQYSIAATVNICQYGVFFPGFPLKASAPGTNVTVVSPAAAAQNAYNINVYYYLAP